MKKQLNTMEEVIKALKEGKEVIDNDNIKYKMIGGIICGNSNINVSILYVDYKKYFIEVEEPIKFEINRAYKTRSGEKVYLCEMTDNEIINFIEQYFK